MKDRICRIDDRMLMLRYPTKIKGEWKLLQCPKNVRQGLFEGEVPLGRRTVRSMLLGDRI